MAGNFAQPGGARAPDSADAVGPQWVAPQWVVLRCARHQGGVVDGDDVRLPAGGGRDAWFQDAISAPQMVVVPAGAFVMGSSADEAGHCEDEGPPRRVEITRPFAIGRFAVTFAEWDAAVAAGAISYSPDDEGGGRGMMPVVSVSRADALLYCAWLSAVTGQRYRLPSEAEWEYAARAGTTTAYWWGDNDSAGQANVLEVQDYAADGSFLTRTVAVDRFAANPWGLFQVHGNVWEWVADDWFADHVGAPGDGSARIGGDVAAGVLRGGCWCHGASDARSAARLRQSVGYRFSNFGLRVVRDISEA